MRVCTRCGNVATGQQRFCTRCVAPLDPAEPADDRPAPWWEDDPYWADPHAVDDWFAGGEAETSVMPLLVDDPAQDADRARPAAAAGCTTHPADPRHASAGRRAQIISAVLAAVAAAAGALTAWSRVRPSPADRTPRRPAVQQQPDHRALAASDAQPAARLRAARTATPSAAVGRPSGTARRPARAAVLPC